MYNDSIQKIKSDNYQTDPLINSSTDNRYGLTLLTRPDNEVNSRIQLFLNELKKVDPHQYYYPESDIHITVMSIISCYAGFSLSDIVPEDYAETIRKSLADFKNFNLRITGVTASPSCILLQGFFSDNSLNNIRNTLRSNFRGSSLRQSIDERYTLRAAHSTVVRFQERIIHKNDFINVLDKYRDFNFGTFSVDSLILVYTDWYHRKNLVKDLYRFKI